MRFYSYGYLVVNLFLAVLYAIVSFVGPHSVLEIPLGLFALLWAPGYALAAPLLVRQPGLSWAVNLPIVVGLSAVVNVLIGIALLRAGPGLSTLGGAIADLVIALLGLILFIGREVGEVQSSTAPSASEDIAGPLRALRQRMELTGFSTGQRVMAVTLLVLILVVIGIIVYVAASNPHPGLAVSLAMYGPGGTTASLPTSGTNTTVLTVELSVQNGAAAQGFVLNVTSELVAHPNTHTAVIAWSQPLPLGRATTSLMPFTLGGGKEVSIPVLFELTTAGNATMTFSLYTVMFTLENAGGSALQSVTLPLNITAAG